MKEYASPVNLPAVLLRSEWCSESLQSRYYTIRLDFNSDESTLHSHFEDCRVVMENSRQGSICFSIFGF